MKLFGLGKVSLAQHEADLGALRAELNKVASALRQLEAEQITLHAQARKWMRRAAASEQRVEEREQHTNGGTQPPPRKLFGARRRIAERLGRGDPAQAEEPEVSDGVHS